MKSYSDIIFDVNSKRVPWGNHYQGNDKRVVFVCSAGILRSATAARMYAHKYNTRAAGSHSYALIPLSDNLLAWAEEVVFVNEENYREACKNWDLDAFTSRVVVLDIPDRHMHMDSELVAEFERQYEPV